MCCQIIMRQASTASLTFSLEAMKVRAQAITPIMILVESVQQREMIAWSLSLPLLSLLTKCDVQPNNNEAILGFTVFFLDKPRKFNDNPRYDSLYSSSYRKTHTPCAGTWKEYFAFRSSSNWQNHTDFTAN